MKQLIKVADENGLYRDPETGSVVNLNDTEYQKYLKNKQHFKRKREEELLKEKRLNNLEQEVASLKSGINQILDLLKNGR